MLTIYIDGEPYEINEGENLLSACLSLGFDIPYFCWHPALHSVGACRVCAVKQYRDENDERGRIIMSCTTPAEDGMRISIEDPEVKRFRASVVELLMINHPHDCPVCDEGGECHLQDMTLMTGHNYRRYRFTKRTYINQDLGPFVSHEMNRCIQCYRCVRYYRDYAGGRDLDILGTHDNVYFGRYEGGMLESEFSGNLVEVCPTGVFTDATLKGHYTRKWDIQSAPSICVHCGLGCNTITGERYGSIRCTRNRFNGDVNGYFLCDRGRYGYGFVNSEARIREVLAREEASDPLKPADAATGLKDLGKLLHFGMRVIGIGSPRASMEANHALRLLVGEENFFAGFSPVEERLVKTALEILNRSHVNIATLGTVQTCDAVFVLGEDVTNTAPRLALALRQTVIQQPYREAAREGIPFWEAKARQAFIQDEKGPLFTASFAPTRLDDIAADTRFGAPDDLARLGFAVANRIDPSSGGVEGLTEEDDHLASSIAEALMGAERPLVVSGTGVMSEEVMRAAQNVAVALKKAGRESSLFLVVPECNSLGLALMGAPGLQDALDRADSESTVIVLENDLARRMERERFESFCSSNGRMVVIDYIRTETSSRAGLVLPAASYAESDGTYVNTEGRAQKSFQVLLPGGDIRQSWEWISGMMSLAGHPMAGKTGNPDDIIVNLARNQPVFEEAAHAAPGSRFRVHGLKIPRQPYRYSGRTAMNAHISVHESQVPPDPYSPLAFTMEGYDGYPPAPLIPRYLAPGWNSPQAVEKYQSRVGGPLTGGNPGVRLLERAHGGPMTYHGTVPAASLTENGNLLLVPLYHIFGTEELSSLAPEISGISPKPYIALNPLDARSLDVDGEGAFAELNAGSTRVTLPVRIINGLHEGLAGLPWGLKDTEWIALPQWITVRKGTA